MKDYADIDSKFRFVILASKRAKELLKGAKPKIKSKSKNLIRIAQEEVEQGLIEFEIIESPADEVGAETENRIVDEDLLRGAIIMDSKQKPSEPKAEAKAEKEEKKEDKKTKKKAEKKVAVDKGKMENKLESILSSIKEDKEKEKKKLEGILSSIKEDKEKEKKLKTKKSKK